MAFWSGKKEKKSGVTWPDISCKALLRLCEREPGYVIPALKALTLRQWSLPSLGAQPLTLNHASSILVLFSAFPHFV